MGTSVKQLREKWLERPGVRHTMEENTERYALVSELISARARAGLTQAQVAERMGSKQSVIARIEGGALPTLKTLQRYAEAVGCVLVVRLVDASALAQPRKPKRASANADPSDGGKRVVVRARTKATAQRTRAADHRTEYRRTPKEPGKSDTR